MKRIFVTVLLFIIMFIGLGVTFPNVKEEALSISGGVFGGKILLIKTCDDRVRKFIKLGPPLSGDFIYVPPAKYLYGEPSHVNQWLLGVSQAQMECEIAKVPVFGNKISILFGSSK